MKELFNILSTVTDFLKEKRFVYQEKGGYKPKTQLRDKELEKVFPIESEAVKKLLSTPVEKLIAKQAEGEKLHKRAQEKFAYAKSEYQAYKNEAKGLSLTPKQQKEALTKLVHELGIRGPESNWLEGYKVKKGKGGEERVVAALEKDVVRALDNGLKKLPDYNQLVAAYHLFLKGGGADKAHQRRLEKETWNKLVAQASARTKEGTTLLAYLGVSTPKRAPATSLEEALARVFPEKGKKPSAKKGMRLAGLEKPSQPR